MRGANGAELEQVHCLGQVSVSGGQAGLGPSLLVGLTTPAEVEASMFSNH